MVTYVRLDPRDPFYPVYSWLIFPLPESCAWVISECFFALIASVASLLVPFLFDRKPRKQEAMHKKVGN